MANPNRDLFDSQVKRRIELERLSRSEARKLYRFLSEVQKDIIGKMANMRERGLSKATIRQQQRLLDSVNEIHASVYARLRDELNTGFRRLARDQAAFEAGALTSTGVVGSVGTLTARQAIAAFRSRPLEDLGFLQKMVSQLEPSQKARITNALQTSFIQGESVGRAAIRIRGAVAKSRRGLLAFIRTANTHIAASVQQATYEANADLIEEVEWRSILDTRTTKICASRDGNVYPADKGPRPPAHFACRSVVSPLLKGFERPERETYPKWLKRQNAATQKDILGAERFRLYRDDGFEIDDFVDFKGRTIPLDELTR